MKTLILLCLTAIAAGCATNAPPAASSTTTANYTGGQYDETGQNPAFPYNTPHGGVGDASF